MPELVYTPLEDIEKKRTELRNGFKSGKLRSIEYRKYQLLQLTYLVKENAEKLEEALAADMGRPAIESRFIEVNGTITETLGAYNNVEKWAKPEKAPFNMTWFPMKPTVHKEPKGTVLIICPFNYPIWLSLGPIAGALAAGNTVLLKPSESTPATSTLLTELIAKYLDNDLVQVVNGAVAETTKLLELQWDHILYTGSGRVAKIVSAAAAKHLTPVTLELGGKSPVFVDPNCDLEVTAKRILWGKVVNAGQTCVAPDYVLVPRAFQSTLVEALKKQYAEFYPDGPQAKDAYARIVTPQAYNRIKGLVDGTKGKVAIGGETDAEGKYIAPTIVEDVPIGDSLLSEEIFGPVLPIVPVENVDEAIEYVNAHDHPLAIYIFSRDAEFKKKVLTSTQSGGVGINETVLHSGAEGLPFGGIGPSGSGYHTGKHTFDIFTHLRATIDNPSWVDRILSIRYPPYTAKKFKAIQGMQAKLPPKPKGPPTGAAGAGWQRWFVLALAVALAGGLTQRAKSIAGWITGGSARIA